MSATIYYRRLSKSPPTLDVRAPSQFGEIMRRRFGDEPWRVDDSDLQWIQGVIAANPTGMSDFKALQEKVEKHGALEVWSEH